MKTKLPFLIGLILINMSCKLEQKNDSSMSSNKVPVAKKISKEITIHNDTRIDDYFWMRLSDEQKNAQNPDDQTKDVLAYLEDENDYLKASMAHTNAVQDELYNEMIGRIKKDDQSVPVTDNGYSYYTRYEEGQDYALYCRKKNNQENKEEVILNGPKMAKGFTYYGIGRRSVSKDNTMMTYAIDTVSRRRYTIYVKNLINGNTLMDELSNTSGNAVWANDNKTIFYTAKDPITLRADKIYRHELGTNQKEDVLVYHEKDETFNIWLSKTKSKAYIVINSRQTLSTESRVLDANNAKGKWHVIPPRKDNLEYTIDHFGDYFYIRTNYDAKNFRLVKTPTTSTEMQHWVDVIPHRKDIYFQNFDIFKDYLVVEERENGLRGIRIMTWDGNSHKLNFNDPSYLAYATSNLDFDTNILRYNYTSLTTPNSTYEYNMKTKEQTLLKREEIMDINFDPNNYVSERLYGFSRDSVNIPISLVYKKDTPINENTPLLLYAYGSYGNSTEASFSSDRLSLLDRGFVYAIAHIRGGQEMGRAWYENGKLLKKKNTFTDFIDSAEYLIEKGYTNQDHLYAYGGSAGGLLMGAVVNMKPELWNGVVAAVPFVDVVSTMLDETIPLTTFEWDEWGDPRIKDYYDYMKSYSPYDNIESKDYPNMLVTTGYWDSQVQYWEPAKWVAKLREKKTDNNLLVMDCNMDSGHGGASGRFERYKRRALTYAFLLDLEFKNLE